MPVHLNEMHVKLSQKDPTPLNIELFLPSVPAQVAIDIDTIEDVRFDYNAYDYLEFCCSIPTDGV